MHQLVAYNDFKIIPIPFKWQKMSPHFWPQPWRMYAVELLPGVLVPVNTNPNLIQSIPSLHKNPVQ